MSEPIKYTVPVDGYYRVTAKVYHAKPTGKMIEQNNPEWAWYKFWEPKTITVPETEYYGTWDGQEVRFCKAGEVVMSVFLPMRLGY